MDEIAVYSNNVVKLTTEIKVIQDNVCQGMIEIGKRLIEIKKELGHGQWLPYLENELGWKPRLANRFMQIATEFGGANKSSMTYLSSTKIIALLDVPKENREDFIKSTNIEDNTVRQLQDEIKKYKEENGLLTEKQLKALEEKRKAEKDKQMLQSELQREKSKPAKIETKVIEKVVEKVVDKTDYTLTNKISQYESKIKQLENKVCVLEERDEINDELIANCKKEVEEYKQFKDRLLGMQAISGGDYDEVTTLKQVDELYLNIDRLIKTDLSPVKYSGCIKFINSSPYINDSFNTLIDTVQQWCDDMRNELNQNNNIINVEEL